jgi:hypothetical protein
MTFRRLAAIALIFMGTAVAWAILGSSLVARTGQFDGRLEKEVQLLWGPPSTGCSQCVGRTARDSH